MAGALGRNPRTFAHETPDLLNPTHQPFDHATFNAFLQSAETFLKLQLTHVTGYLDKKKLSSKLAADLITLEEELEVCQRAVAEIRAKWAKNGDTFDLDAREADLQTLSSLPAGSTRNIDVDPEGYALIEVLKGTLPQFCTDYLASLERHARYAYTDRPSVLSKEAKARFEKEWVFVAPHERAGMSHPPKAHI